MSDFLHRPDDAAALQPTCPAQASKVEPLAPARFRVHFTASAELRDKLERLQGLMRSSVPDGDLGKVLDQAVTHELERLEARRFGKAKAPRKTLAKTSTKPTSRHIPAAVRRAVHERDRGQCTYVDRLGRRCQARDGLEFHHHEEPFGLGGDHSPKNLRLLCRTHNALMAEKDYGRKKMVQYRRRGSTGTRISEAEGVYGSRPATRGLARSPGQPSGRPRFSSSPGRGDLPGRGAAHSSPARRGAAFAGFVAEGAAVGAVLSDGVVPDRLQIRHLLGGVPSRVTHPQGLEDRFADVRGVGLTGRPAEGVAEDAEAEVRVLAAAQGGPWP